jgi:hypothetical protein
MIDGFVLLTPLLLLPLILLFAFVGCTKVFPVESEEETWPLFVEVRFPPPENVNVEDLRVQVRTFVLANDAFELRDIQESRTPQPQEDGLLLFAFEFLTEEGGWRVGCDVSGSQGPAIIQFGYILLDVPTEGPPLIQFGA